MKTRILITAVIGLLAFGGFSQNQAFADNGIILRSPIDFYSQRNAAYYSPSYAPTAGYAPQQQQVPIGTILTILDVVTRSGILDRLLPPRPGTGGGTADLSRLENKLDNIENKLDDLEKLIQRQVNREIDLEGAVQSQGEIAEEYDKKLELVKSELSKKIDSNSDKLDEILEKLNNGNGSKKPAPADSPKKKPSGRKAKKN